MSPIGGVGSTLPWVCPALPPPAGQAHTQLPIPGPGTCLRLPRAPLEYHPLPPPLGSQRSPPPRLPFPRACLTIGQTQFPTHSSRLCFPEGRGLPAGSQGDRPGRGRWSVNVGLGLAALGEGTGLRPTLPAPSPFFTLRPGTLPNSEPDPAALPQEGTGFLPLTPPLPFPSTSWLTTAFPTTPRVQVLPTSGLEPAALCLDSSQACKPVGCALSPTWPPRGPLPAT